MTLQLCKTACFLLLLLPFLFTSCEDSEHSYYPSVDRIEVSVGKDYIDVTIYGLVVTTEDYISDVQVTRLSYDIILIPFANPPFFGGGAGDAMTSFKKTVHIEGLDKGRYTISVIGFDGITGERSLITETVEIK